MPLQKRIKWRRMWVRTSYIIKNTSLGVRSSSIYPPLLYRRGDVPSNPHEYFDTTLRNNKKIQLQRNFLRMGRPSLSICILGTGTLSTIWLGCVIALFTSYGLPTQLDLDSLHLLAVTASVKRTYVLSKFDRSHTQ